MDPFKKAERRERRHTEFFMWAEQQLKDVKCPDCGCESGTVGVRKVVCGNKSCRRVLLTFKDFMEARVGGRVDEGRRKTAPVREYRELFGGLIKIPK